LAIITNLHTGDVGDGSKEIDSRSSARRQEPHRTYRHGEHFKARHARRLDANLEQEVKVREWCRQRGLTLRITNGNFLAEWWPSSAKLVIGKSWLHAIHCHDDKQTPDVIEDFYRKQRSLWT
jgi:hypothetical protein